MVCPECKTKIKASNYDAAFQWYECPGCDGCFTPDEIFEGELSASSRNGAAHSDARRSSVAARGNGAKKGPVAKGKKRQEQIDADNEAIAEYEKKQTEIIVKAEKSTKHRDEVPISQVVNIMGDEILAIYEELGEHIDERNAQDKALTLWRNLVVHDGITAREKEVPLVLCVNHDA